MSWFWSDDLARLLVEHDAVPIGDIARWIATPIAHRAESDALEFARRLRQSEHEDQAATNAA